MKRRFLAIAAAGIPPEIDKEFSSRFKKTLPDISIMSWYSLDRSKCYTYSYSETLYGRLATNLKEHEKSNHPGFLGRANLVLLYLDKGDGSESILFDRFGAEALIAPLKYPDIASISLGSRNQKGEAVNSLVKEGRRAVGHARELLSVIGEEVTNRDNKTSLLLPRKNFGEDIEKIFDCVRDASLAREGRDEFKKKLSRVSRSLRTTREGSREYFVGRRKLVFKSPGKAGARHGLAPVWESPKHDPSCVIRGRMRFGASYDPQFHYDCDIPSSGSRNFPSCHDTKSVPKDRSHVNIAPNDNIR